MMKRSKILIVGKTLLFITIFFTNILFADSLFEDDKGKIDMHGGKSEMLIDKRNSLSNKDFNTIGINKPTAPTTPQHLIKDEKKTEKITKENK